MALPKFKKVGDVTLGTERLPQPKLGTADFLVTSIKRRENRTSGERFNVSCTCVRSIDGEQKNGDKAGLVYFDSNQYYMQDIKRLVLCLVGMDVSEEEGVIDLQCPVVDDKGNPTAFAQMDDLTRSDVAWNSIINEVGALDDAGEPIAAGSFDGNVILRIETKQRPDKVSDTDFEKAPDGTMMPKVSKGYINSYPVKLIPAEEIADTLTEKEIDLFFGSAENLMELIDIEQG